MRYVASLHSGTDKPFRNVALGVGDMPTPTQLLDTSQMFGPARETSYAGGRDGIFAEGSYATGRECTFLKQTFFYMCVKLK